MPAVGRPPSRSARRSGMSATVPLSRIVAALDELVEEQTAPHARGFVPTATFSTTEISGCPEAPMRSSRCV